MPIHVESVHAAKAPSPLPPTNRLLKGTVNGTPHVMEVKTPPSSPPPLPPGGNSKEEQLNGFIKSKHNAAFIYTAHFLNKFFLPYVLKITGFDFPKAEAERLRNIIKNNQVFLTPNHPRDMEDIITTWKLTEAVSTGFHKQRTVFMADRSVMIGPLRYILPRLGAFSIIRKGNNDAAQQYLQQVALEGDKLIVVYPRGEAEPTNHSAMAPFKYGTANNAVGTAFNPQAKKPVVIAPIVAVYTHNNPEDMRARMQERLARLENTLGMDTTVKKDPYTLHSRLKNVTAAFVDHQAKLHKLGAPPKDRPLIDQLTWLRGRILEKLETQYPQYAEKKSDKVASRVRVLSYGIRDYVDKERAASWSNFWDPFRYPTEQTLEGMEKDKQDVYLARHLSGFTDDAYKTMRDKDGNIKPRVHLTLDQMGEIINKLEEGLHIKKFLRKDPARLIFPRTFETFGPMSVRHRMTEPIFVNDWLAEHRDEFNQYQTPADKERAATQITRLMEQRMQDKLDEIYNTQIYPHVKLYPNPLI